MRREVGHLGIHHVGIDRENWLVTESLAPVLCPPEWLAA